MNAAFERMDIAIGEMTVEREGKKGKEKCLVIHIPLETPAPSKTGLTLVVASSRGNYKTTVVDPQTGKAITIGLNAFVKP